MAQVQTLESLLHTLVAGEAGPLMVAGGGAHLGELEVGVRLMQPVSGAVHRAILAAPNPGGRARMSAQATTLTRFSRIDSAC